MYCCTNNVEELDLIMCRVKKICLFLANNFVAVRDIIEPSPHFSSQSLTHN